MVAGRSELSVAYCLSPLARTRRYQPAQTTNSAPADSHDVSARSKALQTIRAAAANVVPGVSAFTEPKCIQGYILCKAMFAGFSVVAAAESVLMSGGRDHEQPRAF